MNIESPSNVYLQLITCLYPTDVPFSYGVFIAKPWQSPHKAQVKPWISPQKPREEWQLRECEQLKRSVKDGVNHREVKYNINLLNIYTPFSMLMVVASLHLFS